MIASTFLAVALLAQPTSPTSVGSPPANPPAFAPGTSPNANSPAATSPTPATIGAPAPDIVEAPPPRVVNPITPEPTTPAPTTPSDVATPPTGEPTNPVPSTDQPAPATSPTIPADTTAASTTPPESRQPAGPPFATDDDVQTLRRRFGLPELDGEPVREARLRCWIADPTCATLIEVNATAAYAYRGRDGDVDNPAVDEIRWSSGRAQYDLWLHFPVAARTIGLHRYAMLTMGPKGGIITSDSGDMWGNIGVGLRHWLGRGAWAPSIEFSTALSFKLRGRDPVGVLDNTRSPVGVAADLGFGIGGFGAIVVGGQYEPALAGDDIIEAHRTETGGMMFVGFRGNILWGLPAAAAVTTQALVGRNVDAP